MSDTRPTAYQPRVFEAFRITPADKFSTGRTYALSFFRVTTLPGARIETPTTPDAPGTLTEAINAALSVSVFYHKETLLIRETVIETGAVTLHLYTIKRESKPTYVWEGHEQRRIHRHYAVPLCVVDGGVLGYGPGAGQ